MIDIKKIEVYGMGAALRGMRNPKNSWDRSDSITFIGSIEDFEKQADLFAEKMVQDYVASSNYDYISCEEHRNLFSAASEYYRKNAILQQDNEGKNCIAFFAGLNDLSLADRLGTAGSVHGKYLRQIQVTLDITAPLFFWKEFDTYKVGTTANSTSTMHTIDKKPIDWKSFSFEAQISGSEVDEAICDMFTVMNICEKYRKKYLENKDNKLGQGYWRMLIELLPCGWLQTRTVTLSYEVLRNMLTWRSNHKLVE